MIERLLAAGLLRVTEQQHERVAELSHESLIRGWERLRGWLDEERESLRFRQSLDLAHAVWLKDGRKDESLLRGVVLTNAVARWRADPLALTLTEVGFVRASLRARDRARRIRVASVLSTVLLLWLVSFATSARNQATTAKAARAADSAERERQDRQSAARAARAASATAAAALRDEGAKLANQGQWQDAIAKYVAAAKLEPTNAQTVFQLGNVRLRSQDSHGAEADFGTAIRLAQGAPDEQAEYYLKRGNLRLTSGRAIEATQDYEQAIHVAPDNRAGWFAAGRGHEKIAEEKRALTRLRS